MEEQVLSARAALAIACLALLQACAGGPVAPEGGPGEAAPLPAEAAPATALPAAEPAVVAPAAPVRPRFAAHPAPPPVAVVIHPVLDAARLPPFEGRTVAIEEPMRGLAKVDRTVDHDDLWERVRGGFAMPDLKDRLTKVKTAEFANNADSLQRMLDRSRPYLYHIVDEIEKRGLPMELALLPMVESAFNPMAYSRAHASGLWQFIPGTGKRFELEQSWWYDGRRDIVESTKAALDYLTYLYELHGDWHLALAAYNWGEGAVARAIAKNKRARKPTDYASLRMPKETRHYVPKLQALKNILANPAPYGIDLDPIPNKPYFAFVTETPDIDVVLAAKLAEMPVEEFVALNPGFSRPLIRSEVARRIVLPVDKVAVFQENLAELDEEDLASWQVYRPKRGETLAAIAKKSGMTLAELKRVNGIPAWSSRMPKLLVVPTDKEARVAVAKLPLMFASPFESRPLRARHIVRKGDTLSSIARRYRVSVAALKQWNRVGRHLQIGQRILIF